MSQPLDVPELRREVPHLDEDEWAQVLLLVGFAPPTTPAPRRHLSSFLDS